MKKIIFLLTALLLLCACQKQTPEVFDYEETVFDTSYVHEIDILIKKSDYKDLLADPTAKTKYTADVVLDGQKYEEVSFSTKGNSSLYFVADQGSDRFSYKINFSKNRKDQTCHGLDKLNLNNLFKDASYMKDYLSYDIYRSLDVPAPLCAYCVVKINGREHGLYAMVEDVDNSFLKRTWNSEGILYKPEADLELDMEQIQQINENGLDLDAAVNGADLIYQDEDLSSYSDIFDNNVNSSEEEDQKRLIDALKGLIENKELDKHLHTDEIIRYFAVQTYLLNYDGYIGPMLHNYFLHENHVQLSLIPWDYNSAFLTFGILIQPKSQEEITRLINTGIDTPLLLTNEEDRPIWKWIQENESYRNLYHDALAKLIETCHDSGRFEKNDR